MYLRTVEVTLLQIFKMADLHGQELVNRLNNTDRIAAGIPGQEGAKNIRYQELRDQISRDIGTNALRQTVTGETTNVDITSLELAGTDYEIIVDAFNTSSGGARDIVVISNKTISGFTFTVPSGFTGIIIYRVINFNL